MTEYTQAKLLGVSIEELRIKISNPYHTQSMFYVETNESSKGAGMYDTAIPVLQRKYRDDGAGSCS